MNWRRHVATKGRDRWWRVCRVGGRKSAKERAGEDYFDRPHKPPRVPAAAVAGGDGWDLPRGNCRAHTLDSQLAKERGSAVGGSDGF